MDLEEGRESVRYLAANHQPDAARAARKDFMKLTLLTLAIAMSSVTAVAQQAVVQQFVRSATYEAPLTTYDRCDSESWAGVEAAESAAEEAEDACQSNLNIDCVIESTTYHLIESREFLGYRGCRATVLVRGYRVH